MYLTYLVLLGLSVLCNSILLVVFYRHSQKNTTTVSLFILLLLVNTWFIPKFLTNAFHIDGALFESLSRISALGYIFVPTVLLIFAVSFGAYLHIFRRLSFWLILFVPPVILLYLSWTSDLVGVHNYHQATLHPWGYETPTGPFWAHYMVWYDVMILSSIATLIRHFRTMIDQTKRRQTLYFIYAIALPLVVNTVTIGILPIFNIFIFPIGLILIDIVTIVGIALIIRYGWFEVSPFMILSNMHQAILTVDTKGRIIQTNPFAEKLLNKPVDKLNGTSVDKLLFIRHDDKRLTNHTMQLIRLVLSRGKSMTFDSYSMFLDKKQALTDIVSITPIFDERSVVGANIFFRDTRKEKVREKQKEDYFSVLFHELKSPMTSIKAYNQVLERRFSDTTEENKQLFKNVDQQLDRLTRLINDFFELSRLQSGKLTLKKEFFGVDDFVFGIIETMKITHKDRVFSIHGNTNSVVYADKDKIEQILINFINNAIKFSPEDAAIDLHLDANAHKVTIGVQDYGKGIDPKFHKKIFERFFQVNPASKQKMGLGVGLSIISSIIKAHEGKVWVDSGIGKGSTFYFSLPVSKIS
jgi:signal transduction histidine kinase